MSKMTISVEFAVGTELLECVSEAKDKAITWDVFSVQFAFNHITFEITQNCDIYEVMEQYRSCSFPAHNYIRS